MGQFLDSTALASQSAGTPTPADGKKSTAVSTPPVSSVVSAFASGGTRSVRSLSSPSFPRVLFAPSACLFPSEKCRLFSRSLLFAGNRNRAVAQNANSAIKESADSNSATVDDVNDLERNDRLSKEIRFSLP